MHKSLPSDGPPGVNVSIILLDLYRRRVGELALALPAEELDQASRYRRREDTERFIIARALVRRLCATFIGLEPRAITLLRTPSGKPYVEPVESAGGRKKIEFNVSHSGNCVLIAWSRGGPVGIDVEAVKPGRRTLLMEMARSAFAPAEFEVLRSIKSEETAETFYRIWVRKEAVLKAEGYGLGGPMQSFSVVGQTSEGIQWFNKITLPFHDRVWSIGDLKPAPVHAASIAIPLGAAIQECPSIPGTPEI
jgi:4'-phosphopantetheinyl transferase